MQQGQTGKGRDGRHVGKRQNTDDNRHDVGAQAEDDAAPKPCGMGLGISLEMDLGAGGHENQLTCKVMVIIRSLNLNLFDLRTITQ
jgi:hypothetical protein